VGSGPNTVPIDLSHLPGNTQRLRQANARGKELLMWDIVVLALGLGFFVAGIGYAYACERL
jgi:hypothetical protein